MFYTSQEEIALNAFCRDQVKPLLNELLDHFDGFQNLFQRDIKEMKDAFEQNDVYLDEIERQNDLLKDQLLEVSLKHDIELCVLLSHECVDKSLHDELEQVKKKSLEIQEGLKARIKILEKAVQRCEKQSVDFELKLQHEKEKQKWDSSKNKNSKPLDFSWISRIQKLEDENVSLDFKVQSLIKERDNAKMEYKKLFDSIKKTRSQTQKEMDELITHVSEKTYAYGAIRAENQNLLVTISELKARMKNGENGKSVNTKFDKTHGSQSFLCVTPLNKNASQKQTVVLKTKENHVESKPVTSQTSHNKQTGTHQNTNVISPGMYRVVTQQESQTNKTKNVLSSTGMNATSSVKRPKSRDSHVKTSVLDVSKNEAKKEAVYVRKNKQTDNTFAKVVSNKENVIDVAVANASKAKTLLCVSFKRWISYCPVVPRVLPFLGLQAEAVATTCFTQNWSIINTRHNKTPYELLRGRKPNVEYFHVFGSLCYPTNDRDDLGKMKLKADIGVFIGYSKTSRDDLTNTPSKEDLDNLFGPMFEDYFEQKYSDTTINSAAQLTHDQEGDYSSTSLIIIIVIHTQDPPGVTNLMNNFLIFFTESDRIQSRRISAEFVGDNHSLFHWISLNHEEIGDINNELRNHQMCRISIKYNPRLTFGQKIIL
ncbi:retrovirus-related pol polyprotein from transposon TNT 1-94 [Tanacetum coccineum]